MCFEDAKSVLIIPPAVGGSLDLLIKADNPVFLGSERV